MTAQASTRADAVPELPTTGVSTRGASLHALTGLGWAVAAALCVELAPSPVYVAIVVAVAALVVEVHAGDSPYRKAFPALVAIGVVFALVRVALTALTTHGVGDAIVTVPSFTLPTILGGFTVGGTVELPVVLQAAAEGFALVGVMAVFGAFNAVVSHAELLERLPRAFYSLGLALSVALAFVPSTIAAIHTVREADRARTGGVVRRRGRVRRQVVPVLERGLERAIALSESMDARGLGRGNAPATERTAALTGLLGVVLLGAGFVALVGGARAVAVACGVSAAAAIVVATSAASRASGRSRYRPRAMTSRDRWVLALTAAAPIGLALLTLAGDASLVWTASPLRWPSFHLLPALALAPLLAPLLVDGPRR